MRLPGKADWRISYPFVVAAVLKHHDQGRKLEEERAYLGYGPSERSALLAVRHSRGQAW